MTCPDKMVALRCPYDPPCPTFQVLVGWEESLDVLREHMERCPERPVGYDCDFTVSSTVHRTAKAHTLNVTSIRGLRLDPPYDAEPGGGLHADPARTLRKYPESREGGGGR